MRVLLLSITAGAGHNSTGKAIIDCLNEDGIKAEMLDAFEYITPVLSETVAKGYLISTQFSPKVYGKLYRLAEKKERKDGKFSVKRLISSLLNIKLVNYVNEFAPDVIICTHIFAAQLVSHLKTQKKLSNDVKTIGIVTDFTIHPFWEETNLDYYVLANELLINQLAKKGIPKEKALPIGIPVAGKFAEKINKTEARNALKIGNKFTVFVMSGSMGYGRVEKIIKQLDGLDVDFQILSVCGNNKSLKKKIDKFNLKKDIYNFGFVNNVDVMMSASDYIITKPGGLTISESMAKNLPAILINPIPGQEDRNAEFLVNNGISQIVTKTYSVDEALYQYFSAPWRKETFKTAVENLAKPNATKDLCEFIKTFERK